MLDVPQGVEGQFLQIKAGFGQGLDFRSGIIEARPGDAVDLLGVRISFLPEFVAQEDALRSAVDLSMAFWSLGVLIATLPAAGLLKGQHHRKQRVLLVAGILVMSVGIG